MNTPIGNTSFDCRYVSVTIVARHQSYFTNQVKLIFFSGQNFPRKSTDCRRLAGQLSHDDVRKNDDRKAREVSRGSREFDGRSIPEIGRDDAVDTMESPIHKELTQALNSTKSSAICTYEIDPSNKTIIVWEFLKYHIFISRQGSVHNFHRRSRYNKGVERAQKKKDQTKRTNDVCCTNLRNLLEHQLPEEVEEEEEGVCESRRVLAETKGSAGFVLINGSKQRKKPNGYIEKCAKKKTHCSSFIAIEAKGERNVLEAPLSYDQDPLTQGNESNFRLISTGSFAGTFPLPIGSKLMPRSGSFFFSYYAQQAVTRKCKFQIAFIRPAGNAPRRKDATMEIIQFPTNWDVLQMKLKYSSLYLIYYSMCIRSTLIFFKSKDSIKSAFKSEIDGFLTNKINRKSNFPMSFKRGNAFSDYLMLIELTFKIQRGAFAFRKFTELRKRIAQNSVYIGSISDIARAQIKQMRRKQKTHKEKKMCHFIYIINFYISRMKL
ncbi:hypothetical protein ALC53_04502 [Atta colombica]|uniref:Uncharacterized protein n=1 Tax=Atta colombica TaxID=520822 RepID=A0A195BLH8_9HYME|nr:hypothetical protein ALC53_04502 [Atta colombica]